MKNSSKQIDRKILKTLEPLNRLNPILLDELAAKSVIDEVSAGKIICRHSEKDSRQIYLLSGQIEVVTPGEKKTKVIKSKSAVTTAIAEGSPRKVTLKAKANSTLLYIDTDLLELLMSDEPELNPTYEVTEISADDNDDWMLTFLQSPAFLQLPTENIQKLLTHMEEISVKKGQVVIQQGATDDNYYIIKSGCCNVHRQPYKGSASVLLATLPTGSGFGEEALISNGTRNATITMREDGALMKLKKKDFLTLLINPLIPYFEHNETQQKLDAGCVVIDVRSEEESKQKPLEGAVNIPLSMLRLKFNSLNTEREYLLVCNDGSQSAAAAFLMIQGGLKCNVLRNGMGNSKTKLKVSPSTSISNTSASTKASEQAAAAKKQTEQIKTQQEEIKAAREKAEKDILKHKKELAESRARIAQKKQTPTLATVSAAAAANQKEMAQLKEKAAQELAKAQAESKAIELRQQETAKNVLRAEEIVKQSAAAAAEQTRKQAQQEAELIKQRAVEEAELLRAEKEAAELAKLQAQEAAALMKQRAIEEAEQLRVEKAAMELAKIQAKEEAAQIKQKAIEDAEHLRAEKAAAELAKAQAESEAIERRQQETNEAMLLAEEMMKQTAAKAEQARKQAEEEAALIKQKAIEEAGLLRAEVDAARQKMEQDAARIKEEEKLIKDSALKMRNEADEIRRAAMEDAQQVRSEIDATRALLDEKLQQTQDEEKRKHDAILAEAKAQADKLAQNKTEQAIAEAEAIRQQAKEDALRLHNELETTRNQIEAEAARVISGLKERSEQAEQVVEQNYVADSALQTASKEAQIGVDYAAVSIPGMSDIAPINNAVAERKAIAIKEKLAQSQKIKASRQAATNEKMHRTDTGSVLVTDDDLFIFQEPKTPAHKSQVEQAPTISHRTQAESALTQISINPEQEASKSVVIYPQRGQQAPSMTNNPFLNQTDESAAAQKQKVQQFDRAAYARSNHSSKSNTFAIAASFLLIIAGAIFTLHATDTLKVQSIAALFNSGNDTTQAKMAIAKSKEKTIRRKVLRADTKINVKKKVTNKVDDIMQGWKDVLSESQSPKKSK